MFLKPSLLRRDHVELILVLHALGLSRAVALDVFEGKYGFRVSARAYRVALGGLDRTSEKGLKLAFRYIEEHRVERLRPAVYVLLDNLKMIEVFASSGLSYREIGMVLSENFGCSISEDQVQKVVSRVRNGYPEEYLERTRLLGILTVKSEGVI